MKRAWPLAILLLLTSAWASGCITSSKLVQIHTETSMGSGFAVDETDTSYVIVTAKHCVQTVGIIVQFDPDDPWAIDIDLDKVTAARVMVNGIESAVVAVSSTDDVAVVHMPKRGQQLHVWPLADAQRGEPVVAYGYIQGSFGELYETEWHGRVVAAYWYYNSRPYVIHNAGTFFGCSGGPVVNRHGQVVGITHGVVERLMTVAVPVSALQGVEW